MRRVLQGCLGLLVMFAILIVVAVIAANTSQDAAEAGTEPTRTARAECPTEAEQAYLTALRQNIRVISGRVLALGALIDKVE